MKNTFLANGFISHNTGRLSSAEPNLQNVPRENGIRELFIPDEPGDEFMGVDYKQLEVRVAAGLSKDIILIREILDGVDMHSRNAAQFVLKMQEEEFKRIRGFKDDPESALYERACELDRIRSTAKAVTFGVLYGSSAHGVSVREKVPIEECELFINNFFRKYPHLSGFIRSQQRKVRSAQRVTTPTGRFYHFPDFGWLASNYCFKDDGRKRIGDINRIAVNMPIQSYGSDIFQIHKLKVFRYILKNHLKSRLVLSLHDGFLLNVKPDEKEELREVVPGLMKSYMNKGTKYEVPLEVDVEFTDRWHGK